ncbi:MAG: TIGR03936 family radical SAM-associated protein, partial [Acidimicrobiales bacterium]
MRFTKLGKVRFTSHRDLARIWERALRKAAVPVAYTEGFSPRPKLHFGLALSTGYESLGEYLDVDLAEPVDAAEAVEPAGLAARLSRALPEGIGVGAVAELAPDDRLSLQEAVTSCSWRVLVEEGDLAQVQAAAAATLAATEIVAARERKGKKVVDDLRPYVRALAAEPGPEGGTLLVAELGAQPRGLRPAELLAVLSPPLHERRVCRTHQWIERDGARREPLTASSGATPPAHAEACAPGEGNALMSEVEGAGQLPAGPPGDDARVVAAPPVHSSNAVVAATPAEAPPAPGANADGDPRADADASPARRRRGSRGGRGR